MRRGLVTTVLVLACTSCAPGSASAPASLAPAKPSQPYATPSAGPSVTPSASTSPAAEFTSSAYGYTATVPSPLVPQPATAEWDGGDVDHTADYADRFADPETAYLFVIGTPTRLDTRAFANLHADWLTSNRDCTPTGGRSATTIGGQQAERLSFRCRGGIFDDTFVDKAVAVHQGTALVFTSMTPATGATADPLLTRFLESVRWTDAASASGSPL